MLTVACRVSGAVPPPGAAPSLSRRAQARSWRRRAPQVGQRVEARSVVVDLPLGSAPAPPPPDRAGAWPGFGSSPPRWQAEILAGDALPSMIRHRVAHRDGGSLVQRHPIRHTPGAERERQLVAVCGHRKAGFGGAAASRREQLLDRDAAGAAVAEHDAPAAAAARVAEHDRAPFAGIRRQHRHRHPALRDAAAQDRDTGSRAGRRGGAGASRASDTSSVRTAAVVRRAGNSPPGRLLTRTDKL